MSYILVVASLSFCLALVLQLLLFQLPQMVFTLELNKPFYSTVSVWFVLFIFGKASVIYEIHNHSVLFLLNFHEALIF